jgi:hypothetical protein
MLGRNPLLVAKEHGHRIITMLTVYAAWTEGAVESDIAAIRAARKQKRSSARGTASAVRKAAIPTRTYVHEEPMLPDITQQSCSSPRKVKKTHYSKSPPTARARCKTGVHATVRAWSRPHSDQML